jgi:hypothetical protein
LEQLEGWPASVNFGAIGRSPSPLAAAALGALFGLFLLLGHSPVYRPSATPVDADSGDSHTVTFGVDRKPVPARRSARTLTPSTYTPSDYAIRIPVPARDADQTVRQLKVSVRAADIHTPVADARGCYSYRIQPYEYDGQSDNPFCRVTVAGAVEHALSATVSYGRGARVLTEPLRPGRHPIVDSFGHPFGFFKQISRERFRIYDQWGRLYGTSGRGSVAEVQGRGCMVTNAMSDRYMILVLRGPGLNTGIGPGGAKRDVGARGFVPRSALRPGVFHRANRRDSADNDTVIDSFYSGCGAPPPQPTRWQPAAPFAKPFYGSTARYQGAKRRCASALAPTCGGHYGDYSRPHFAGDVVPLTSASTGVRNGGIVRAYARTSQPWRLVDAIGYADPNVPCGHSPTAQWLRVDANPNPAPGQNHIFGWFPQPVSGLPPRRC